jgi:glutathione synthase/RimK-type ligase-like ATP-grasp enzyme
MRDWLVAHGIPHPRTDVFYDREKALAFVNAADYPLVCKTDASAASNGVFVLRDKRAARGMVRDAFGRGLLPRQWDRRDRQRGSILFQTFVPHDHEWRVVRIGDDYLCRMKARVGDFASGSGGIEWAKPTEEMLSFVEEVTTRGGFTSMGVDFFDVCPSGPGKRYLVNELQCLVGAIENEQNRNEHTGKWRRVNGNWEFEPGFFYQNACANLRVAYVLNELRRASRAGDMLTVEVRPG